MKDATRLRHIGIVVKDLQLCKEFWERGFDMQVRWDQIEEGDYIDELFRRKNTKVRTVKLQNSDGLSVELLQFMSDYEQKGLDAQPVDFGLRHIALSVGCLKSKVEYLCSSGAYMAPRLVDTPDRTHRLCYFRGPEGLILELVQEL